MTIYIGNLSFDAEIEDIVGVFSSYGEVANCKLPLERETGRKRVSPLLIWQMRRKNKKQSMIFKMLNGWVERSEFQKPDRKIINFRFQSISDYSIF